LINELKIYFNAITCYWKGYLVARILCVFELIKDRLILRIVQTLNFPNYLIEGENA